MIQATGFFGSGTYDLTITDENGNVANPFALAKGRYQVCITDIPPVGSCHPGCGTICLDELVNIL